MITGKMLDEAFRFLLELGKIQELCAIRQSLNRDLSNQIHSFPKNCNQCGLKFGDGNKFLKKTRSLAYPEESVARAVKGKETYYDFRMCSCRSLLPFEIVNRRDSSTFGVKAREIFAVCETLLEPEKRFPSALIKPLLREIFRQIIKNGYFSTGRIDWDRVNSESKQGSPRHAG